MNDNRKQPADDMLVLLGELKAMVASVKDDVDEVKQEMNASRVETTASRRRMYDKLDGVDKRLTRMESTVTVMGGVVNKQTNRIDSLEPMVKKTQAAVRMWALRWGLVTALLGGIGSALYWLFTTKWPDIWAMVVQFIKSSP